MEEAVLLILSFNKTCIPLHSIVKKLKLLGSLTHYCLNNSNKYFSLATKSAEYSSSVHIRHSFSFSLKKNKVIGSPSINLMKRFNHAK